MKKSENKLKVKHMRPIRQRCVRESLAHKNATLTPSVASGGIRTLHSAPHQVQRPAVRPVHDNTSCDQFGQSEKGIRSQISGGRQRHDGVGPCNAVNLRTSA